MTEDGEQNETISNRKLKMVTTICPSGSKTVQQVQILPPATKLFILKQLHYFLEAAEDYIVLCISSGQFHGWSCRVYWLESENGARRAQRLVAIWAISIARLRGENDPAEHKR